MILATLNQLSLMGPQKIGPLSYALKEGEGVLLKGPSGCGKTTLLRGLAGFLPSPWHFEGHFTFLSPPFYFSQYPKEALNPYLNIRQFFKSILKSCGKEEKELLSLLKSLDLDLNFNLKPQELSVGMCQRVLLAALFLIEPRVVLLDEPFSHLDCDRRGQALVLLQNFLNKGNGVLIVSHTFEENWPQIQL